jgi:hypothetical protein
MRVSQNWNSFRRSEVWLWAPFMHNTEPHLCPKCEPSVTNPGQGVTNAPCPVTSNEEITWEYVGIAGTVGQNGLAGGHRENRGGDQKVLGGFRNLAPDGVIRFRFGSARETMGVGFTRIWSDLVGGNSMVSVAVRCCLLVSEAERNPDGRSQDDTGRVHCFRQTHARGGGGVST